MTQSLNDSVSAEIRAEMGRQQVTGADLARRLGRSPAWVSYRLNGIQAIGLDDLDEISRVLDVPVHRFLPARVA